MNEGHVAAYSQIATSASSGFRRIAGARIVSNLAVVAILQTVEQRLVARQEEQHEPPPIRLLSSVSPREFQEYLQVRTASLLVYGTAILDTFLTDTTKFLLLLQPHHLASNTPITWDAFISQSRAPIINEAVNRKVRQVAFWPFNRRLEYLAKTFELDLKIDPTVLRQLEHFSGIRNAIVHDQGLFEILLTDAEQLSVERRDAPHVETEMAPDEFRSAMHAYFTVVRDVYAAVIGMLEGERSNAFASTRKVFDRAVEAFAPLTASELATAAAAQPFEEKINDVDAPTRRDT